MNASSAIAERHATYVPIYRRFEDSDLGEAEATALVAALVALEVEVAAMLPTNEADLALQIEVAKMSRGEIPPLYAAFED